MTLLTAHFSLEEFAASETADAHGIDNSVPSSLVLCLAQLCAMCLEPIRAQFGPLRISSGYRCAELNALVGGVADSEHVSGCAADIVPVGGWTETLTREAMVAWCAANIHYDQCIDEGAPNGARWVHVGIAPAGQPSRQQALLFQNGKYTPFVLPSPAPAGA